ncbi:MAG: ThiF family adenylyltransferase [Dehalococcoidia bacterium]
MISFVGADEILEQVNARGLLQSPRVVEVEGEKEVEGELVLPSGAIHTVRLPKFLPLNLPAVRLIPTAATAFLPHVTEDKGTICYAGAEGLVLNSFRPGDLLEEALKRVEETLDVGTSDERGAEFVDEFEIYWANLPNPDSIRNVADPSSDPGWRILLTAKGKPTYLANTVNEVSAYYSTTVDVGGRTIRKVPYFPLAEGSVLVPPSRASGVWSVAAARRALLPCLAADHKRRMLKMLGKRPKSMEYCFFDLPRTNGGSTIFGLKFIAPGTRHPLLEGGTAESVVPVVVRRTDRSFLLPRGGASVSLTDCRVLVVGCGAIGGHVVLELARGGLLRQTLLDPDSFQAENAFRHALGKRYDGEKKAEAMAKELRLQLPYVEVEGIAQDVVGALSSGRIQLDQFDLVVAATGNPTVEMFMEGELHRLEQRPKAIYSWVEPMGIGGHAVLTGVPEGRGCLRCLFTARVEGLPDLHNRLAFAEQGVSYGRALSGCGSLHMPFGSLDALRTAEISVRLAIQSLQGEVKENVAVSWRGEATEFRGQGHHTTPRYEMDSDKTELKVSDFDNPRCPVCHGDECG